jgi:hypothetical protein
MAKGKTSRSHTPSEVNRLSQSSQPQTHMRDFGMANPSKGGDPFNNMPGVALPDKTASAPRTGSGDGLGKMSRGMGGTRQEMTTPAAPPPPTKRATGTP